MIYFALHVFNIYSYILISCALSTQYGFFFLGLFTDLNDIVYIRGAFNKVPGHQLIARTTTKPTPQNKIYYGTQTKRTTIFRHLHKKHNWQNNHRYLPQTNRYPTIPPLQQPLPQNCIKSIPYTLVRRIDTIITDKKLKKNMPQRTTHNPTPERISHNSNK